MTLRRAARRQLGPVLALCKFKVSLLAAASAVTGFVMASPRFTADVVLAGTGVFILACGAGALNEYQERNLDACMERTKCRPLPSRRISAGCGLSLALTLIIAGGLVLRVVGPTPSALGLAAVLWYNGFYTPLKRHTAFAAVPGALVGALPPAIGWVSAGSPLADPRCGALCLVFFMWQVPHFWLLILDRGHEYQQSGFPSLGDIFSQEQMRRVISLWILGTACGSLLLSSGARVGNPLCRGAILGASLWLAVSGIRFFRGRLATGAALFRRMNVYLVLIFAAFFVGRLVDVFFF